MDTELLIYENKHTCCTKNVTFLKLCRKTISSHFSKKHFSPILANLKFFIFLRCRKPAPFYVKGSLQKKKSVTNVTLALFF